MPTSSTVWCRSTSRSPVGADREIEARVLAELLEHVVEERDAGARPRWCRCRRPRARRRPSSPSSRGGAAPIESPSDLLECGEERVVLGGRADRDPETLLDARPAREVAHEHAARQQSFPELVRVAVDPEQQEVRARRVHVQARRSRRAPRTAGRAPRRATRRALPSRRGSRARPCRRAASAPTALYGSATFSSSSTTHAGATAKPSRIAASDHTFEYVRTTTSGRDSSTSSIALHGANSPYASSTTSRAPCSAASVARRSTCARSSTVPVGLFGLHTNTIAGRADGEQLLGRVDVDREVGGPLPHDDLGARDPRDVRVQRVRRLEHRRAPARPAVGEQQRLQHLVGSVRREQPRGRLAEERAEARPQRVRGAVGIAVELDVARLPRATARRTRPVAGTGSRSC